LPTRGPDAQKILTIGLQFGLKLVNWPVYILLHAPPLRVTVREAPFHGSWYHAFRCSSSLFHLNYKFKIFSTFVYDVVDLVLSRILDMLFHGPWTDEASPASLLFHKFCTFAIVYFVMCSTGVGQSVPIVSQVPLVLSS